MEIIEVIRQWQAGRKIREIARSTGIARNTVRKYVLAAQSCGLSREGPPPDEAQVIALVQHGRAGPRDAAVPTDKVLEPLADQIHRWIKVDHLKLTRIQELLAQRHCVVPYRSLGRYVTCKGWFGKSTRATVRMADTEPGQVAEVDFGRLGLVRHPEAGRIQGKYHKPKGAGGDLRIEPEAFQWRLSTQFLPWVGLKIHLGGIGIVEVSRFHYRTEGRLGQAGFVVECVPVTEGDQALVAQLEEQSTLPRAKRDEIVAAMTGHETLTLNIPQVAEVLGISKTSAYAAAHRGDLPGVIRFGKRIMVGRAALEKALREGWSPPSSGM